MLEARPIKWEETWIVEPLQLHFLFSPDRPEQVSLGASLALKGDKLLAVGFIKEIQYPEWLSNVVVVPKKNDKWRVCIDYTNLNDACLKDTFSLPQIDLFVDSTAGPELLLFLDTYSGYNHILMYPSDMAKIPFITSYDMYYYNMMPFDLKNA